MALVFYVVGLDIVIFIFFFFEGNDLYDTFMEYQTPLNLGI